MIGPPLLAAVILMTSISLESGAVKLKVPSGLTVTRRSLNWETDKYIFRRKSDGFPLIEVIVGGGAYDVSKHSVICLHHKRAWRRSSSYSLNIIMGEPGVNSASIAYAIDSPRESAIAEAVMSSVIYPGGPDCRA